MQKISLLEIGLEFGMIIAIPLIALIGLGLYLDKKYGTVPLFILIGLFTALGISSIMLYKKINEILNNK
ncbi:MAG: AtpZ/AtpI family protein [Candidatus Peregrinibacteria bacterium]